MEGFHTHSKNGEYTGMDVEYLDALSAYTNWDIEYVDCDSWDDALEMLKNGEADLVGSAQYSQERAEEFLYADFASGYTFGAVMVNSDSELAYEDFEAMADVAFGIVKTYIRKDEFLQYMAENGIEQPKLKEYNSTKELQQALDEGEVDAIVHSFMELEAGQRIVGKFAPSPYYYISSRQNEEIMKELNLALSELKMQNPALESSLMNKYYTSKLNQTQVLSLAEKKYAAALQTLNVGYLDGYYPFSYEDDGAFAGISRNVLDEVAKQSGIALNYQKMDSLETALEDLKNGTIDILGYCLEDSEKLKDDASFSEITYATTTYLLGDNSEAECLELQDSPEGEHRIALVYRETAEEELQGILHKTVQGVEDWTINDYVLRHPAASRFDLKSWLMKYGVFVSIPVILIILVILMVVSKLLYDSQKMQCLLYKDPELGIWNLNYLTIKGKTLVAEKNARYVIAYINVIRFRTYCTLYGRTAGNRLLGVMAEEFSKNMDNKEEILARCEGDRFALLLRVETPKQVEARLRDLAEHLQQRFYEELNSHVEICMGICYLSQYSSDIQTAITRANQALDFPGNAAKGSIRVYDETLRQKIYEERQKEEILEAADVNRDFAVYYQAKVDIRGEKIIGAEALVRFLDPSANGQVRAPGYFISYYEKTGRIKKLDFFVLEQVCQMLRRRLDQGLKVVPVSCNFSRWHFVEEGFSEKLEQVMDRYHISRELIEVEITETMIIEEVQQKQMRLTLQELQQKGIHLSIDDFGAGYSSLGIFEQVPASVIKLDRSFLMNHSDHDRQVKIMREIVNLAATLDAQVVCEGVENSDDVELMHEIGAYVAQGYFYARPIPERDFESQLSRK
jgi:EAL domain-containing protein (putative c-di-GMP-specific phosphodiesterase class I)/ABC-type amino acid transport substrate-binding protein